MFEHSRFLENVYQDVSYPDEVKDPPPADAGKAQT